MTTPQEICDRCGTNMIYPPDAVELARTGERLCVKCSLRHVCSLTDERGNEVEIGRPQGIKVDEVGMVEMPLLVLPQNLAVTVRLPVLWARLLIAWLNEAAAAVDPYWGGLALPPLRPPPSRT